MNLFDLNNKTALITGSSQGIGLALARGLAAAGAKVILNGRDVGKLDETATELTSLGASVITRAFDVTDHNAVKRWVLGKYITLAFPLKTNLLMQSWA